MINRNNLKFWIPVGIVVGCQIITLLCAPFMVSKMPPRTGGYHLLMTQAYFASMISFCLSLILLVFFCSKNRKHGLWFVLLYALAFAFPSFFSKDDYYSIAYNFVVLTRVFNYSCYAFIVYLASDWFIKQKRTQELEKKNLQSELAMLKNQINPHFLFNTLNNIDSMIKKNPDCASQSIIELSEMMRYMIYEANVEKVPLKKELDYIDNYLHLQKLQYSNPELINYNVSGESEQIEVAPMLFIPFVENAFKHCTNKETKHAIRFSFSFDTRQICFEATNIADKTQIISKDKTSGIGLDTIKRRLEILYPQQHILEIQEKNDLFCVSLKIKIND